MPLLTIIKILILLYNNDQTEKRIGDEYEYQQTVRRMEETNNNNNNKLKKLSVSICNNNNNNEYDEIRKVTYVLTIQLVGLIM